MSITRKTINGNEYEFVNSFRGNRSGFVHETTLYRNNQYMGENKIQYYNRTWESYTYQSVMKNLVYDMIEDCKAAYKSAWKTDHNIQRLTKEKKEAMEADFENNPPKNYMELKELYGTL